MGWPAGAPASRAGVTPIADQPGRLLVAEIDAAARGYVDRRFVSRHASRPELKEWIVEMVDSDSVQRWLDHYSHAWETYSLEEIGALFSEDAEYRFHPWDEGDDIARGQDAIVAAWLESRDTPGTYQGVYRPLLVQGDVAIAVGTSSYYTDETHEKLERRYHNLWILRFDADGRCRSFTEWYMKAPEPGAPMA
jgi:ketosteroid isomerase-like protein